MTPLLFLFIITLVNSEGIENSSKCDGFQANFTVKDVIGDWQVVAIIPENSFPDEKVACHSYKVEFSEIEAAGLKWLLNKTIEAPKVLSLDTPRIIILQRYHTENPFDVWSKSIEGTEGCFQQVISLTRDGKKHTDQHQRDAMMQLHLLKVQGSQPLLLQILWGKMVSVVIYRRQQGVTAAELKPVFELMKKLRGSRKQPKICDSFLKDILVF